MTLILIALWIAGHTFQWYWLVVALLLDAIWLAIKLNFLAVLVRRSMEETVLAAMEAAAAASDEKPLPPTPGS